MVHPQTIQIFLPDGDPQGIRVAAITTRIVQVIEVPRVRLDDFLAMPEASYVGFYMLFGEDDDTGAAKAYIGQTGNLGVRLKQHHEKKDFWNRALVAFSLTRSLTVTHAHYLEWLAISRATETGRYSLENGTVGSKPHTPAPMEAECREIFETVDILLTTLGFPIFKSLVPRNNNQFPVIEKPMINDAPEVVQLTDNSIEHELKTADGVDGRARYTEEGLVVLRGSRGRVEGGASFYKHNYYTKRQEMIDAGILSMSCDTITFTRDMLFTSPSPGAVFLLARVANGWVEWKDTSGRTLAEITGRNRQTDGSDG
ncbi:GIY-YIG nuclease family protein [Gluconobacter morbifer]|uniref:DUF4357 domain-containing protein n=1 Tax=Gluconobacter morbifer G707 TaxID=1088869 RepID=G6XJJ3_9PROT|nr:GIY-YIG nuclease family protein [Gluconobacter morbifer]EHH68098.1 hypothetical protein GMO_18650 [Gluconobacter morbifer G707]